MSGKENEKCRILDRNEIIGAQNGCKEAVYSKTYGNKSSMFKILKSILSNYVRFSQSPTRQDSILKTIQYSLWLLSKFYRSSSTKHLPSHRVVESLSKLQNEISWARYLLRFFGFPAAINDIDLKNNWSMENHLTRLGRVMSWTMVAYYPLENLAYLLWKAPGICWLPIVSPINTQTSSVDALCPNPEKSKNTLAYRFSADRLASKASAWSCRFWLAWIAMDIVRCTLTLKEMEQPSHKLGTTKQNSVNDTTESVEHSERLKKTTIRKERIRILRDILYVLPAINWSLPNWDTQPWLSGDLVNGLCWLESMVGLFQGIDDFRRTQL